MTLCSVLGEGVVRAASSSILEPRGRVHATVRWQAPPAMVGGGSDQAGELIGDEFTEGEVGGWCGKAACRRRGGHCARLPWDIPLLLLYGTSSQPPSLSSHGGAS